MCPQVRLEWWRVEEVSGIIGRVPRSSVRRRVAGREVMLCLVAGRPFAHEKCHELKNCSSGSVYLVEWQHSRSQALVPAARCDWGLSVHWFVARDRHDFRVGWRTARSRRSDSDNARYPGRASCYGSSDPVGSVHRLPWPGDSGVRSTLGQLGWFESGWRLWTRRRRWRSGK